MTGGVQRAEWRDEAALRGHFAKHRRKLGVSTVKDYDASARETADSGKYFNFRDRSTSEWRVGYYDVNKERLTVLTDDEAIIVTHYPCPERHVRDELWRSDYS